MKKAFAWLRYHLKKFFWVVNRSDLNEYLNAMKGIEVVRVKVEKLKASDFDGLYSNKKGKSYDKKYSFHFNGRRGHGRRYALCNRRRSRTTRQGI